MAKMTLAEREARKTLQGEWRTPIPINFVDDDERTGADDGKRYFAGQVRNNIRMAVDRREKQVGDQVKIERHVTLEYYGDDDEGNVNLEDLKYTIDGKANQQYNKIKWDNGCTWVRAGATAKDRDMAKHGKAIVMQEDVKHRSAPPESYPDAVPQKRFQPDARHSAAAPDWDSQVANIKRVMLQQMAAVEADLSKREKVQLASVHNMLPDMQDTELKPRRFAPSAAHSAPPPGQSGDVEAAKPSRKVLAREAQHSMLCCGPCGKNTQTMDDKEDLQPEEPLPEARDIEKEGFFPEDDLDDIIDRINDVVGVWGISEERERELIKPPVDAMNKLVAAAMNTFMNNPLMDLIQYLMDETMDFGVKCTKIGQYLNESFVKPLANALVDGLADAFSAVSWIKDKVTQVIMMMSQMVTDHVVTKSVEQLNDSDAVD